jgi:hypothetical protein
MHANRQQTNSFRIADRGRARRLGMALCAIAASALIAASAAHAADRIYWSNYFGGPAPVEPGSLSYANLDGSGGAAQPTGAAFINGVMGLAIDSATGRLYWANYDDTDNDGTGTQLSWANLDGGASGQVVPGAATVSGPHGAAIDPVTRRIYWPNSQFPGSIPWANLDGSGGGQLGTGAADVNGPRGIALDPVNRKIYWANFFGNTISWANLDGSGGGNINTSGATALNGPEGVAIDPVGNRIYWGDGATEEISYADLGGSGGNDLATPGVTPDHPHGVAIDPIARKIYWTNHNGDTISWANLDGAGGANLSIPGATASGPAQPILLETPIPAGPPTVTGGWIAGKTLNCTQGAWAADLNASLLYRAPESFAYQWIRNGGDVAGATASSFKTTARGDYSCRVTGSNPAGSASQTSAPHHVLPSNVFKFGKLKRNEKKGTATLVVRVPGPGILTLKGRGVVSDRRARPAQALASKTVHGDGNVSLPVRAKGKAKGKLNHTGKVKVKVKVVYTPSGGTPDRRSKTLKLKERVLP